MSADESGLGAAAAEGGGDAEAISTRDDESPSMHNDDDDDSDTDSESSIEDGPEGSPAPDEEDEDVDLRAEVVVPSKRPPSPPQKLPDALKATSSRLPMPGSRSVHRYLLDPNPDLVSRAEAGTAMGANLSQRAASIAKGDIDPWQTHDRMEGKQHFDTITTASGEIVECYQEAAPPPPTTTKGAIWDRDELLKPNRRLMTAQGYDVHAPQRPPRRETYAPPPVREKTTAEIMEEAREEQYYRAQAQIALNRNGELPFAQQRAGAPMGWEATLQMQREHAARTLPATLRGDDPGLYLGPSDASHWAGAPQVQEMRRALELQGHYARRERPADHESVDLGRPEPRGSAAGEAASVHRVADLPVTERSRYLAPGALLRMGPGGGAEPAAPFAAHTAARRGPPSVAETQLDALLAQNPQAYAWQGAARTTTAPTTSQRDADAASAAWQQWAAHVAAASAAAAPITAASHLAPTDRGDFEAAMRAYGQFHHASAAAATGAHQPAAGHRGELEAAMRAYGQFQHAGGAAATGAHQPAAGHRGAEQHPWPAAASAGDGYSFALPAVQPAAAPQPAGYRGATQTPVTGYADFDGMMAAMQLAAAQSTSDRRGIAASSAPTYAGGGFATESAPIAGAQEPAPHSDRGIVEAWRAWYQQVASTLSAGPVRAETAPSASARGRFEAPIEPIVGAESGGPSARVAAPGSTGHRGAFESEMRARPDAEHQTAAARLAAYRASQSARGALLDNRAFEPHGPEQASEPLRLYRALAPGQRESLAAAAPVQPSFDGQVPIRPVATNRPESDRVFESRVDASGVPFDVVMAAALRSGAAPLPTSRGLTASMPSAAMESIGAAPIRGGSAESIRRDLDLLRAFYGSSAAAAAGLEGAPMMPTSMPVGRAGTESAPHPSAAASVYTMAPMTRLPAPPPARAGSEAAPRQAAPAAANESDPLRHVQALEETARAWAAYDAYQSQWNAMVGAGESAPAVQPMASLPPTQRDLTDARYAHYLAALAQGAAQQAAPSAPLQTRPHLDATQRHLTDTTTTQYRPERGEAQRDYRRPFDDAITVPAADPDDIRGRAGAGPTQAGMQRVRDHETTSDRAAWAQEERRHQYLAATTSRRAQAASGGAAHAQEAGLARGTDGTELDRSLLTRPSPRLGRPGIDRRVDRTVPPSPHMGFAPLRAKGEQRRDA